MPMGPGKYDEECTHVRTTTGARAALVIVIDGAQGSGFACQADPYVLATLPDMLENVARQIRASMRTTRDKG